MREARFRSNFNVRSVLHNLETFKKSLILNKCNLTDYQIGLHNGLEMALSMLKNKEANLINSHEIIEEKGEE